MFSALKKHSYWGPHGIEDWKTKRSDTAHLTCLDIHKTAWLPVWLQGS